MDAPLDRQSRRLTADSSATWRRPEPASPLCDGRDAQPAAAESAWGRVDSPMQRKQRLISDVAAGLAPPVIDVEASGIGRHGYPIEVGYVLSDGRCASLMIRPPAHWTFWSAEAECLHGVSRDRLCRDGLDIPDVCQALDAALGARALLSDAWSYDWGWISLLYAEIGRSPPFVLESVRRMLSEDDIAAWHPELAVARARFQSGRHQAVHDAIAIQRALCRIKRIDAAEPCWLQPGPLAR